jgi:hypothetical protein
MEIFAILSRSRECRVKTESEREMKNQFSKRIQFQFHNERNLSNYLKLLPKRDERASEKFPS